MRLWQRAQRPQATRSELVEALSVIPALCSVLDPAYREGLSFREEEGPQPAGTGASLPAPGTR